MKREREKGHRKRFRWLTASTSCKTSAEALERVLSDHGQDLKAVEEAFSFASVPRGDGSEAVRVLPPPSPDAALVLAQQRRARRLATYEQVWSLRRKGWSGKAIAKHLGIGKTTV